MSDIKYTEIEDNVWEKRGKFEQLCEKCGMPNIVLTQPDDYPEYRTAVCTYCQCGAELCWKLPVN